MSLRGGPTPFAADRAAHGSGAPDLLASIVAATQRSVVTRMERRPLGSVQRLAEAATPRGERFHARLTRETAINVIAECKRRSPSRGVLRDAYDPALIARGYESAGAAAVSVLTEPTFFDGSLEHLTAVRSAVSLPILCKDFILTEYQLFEARAAGADAGLLIVAALDDPTLLTLIRAAGSMGLATLVEVHDREELDRAVGAGATIVGVNNRNLRTLEVAVETSHRLIERMPAEVVAVAESGLRSAADLATLRAVGYRAFLIGESLMTKRDPGEALEAMLSRLS